MSTDQYYHASPPPVRRLWLTVFLGYLAFGATLQLLPDWLRDRFGADPAFIGLAVGIAFAATAATRPFAGWAGGGGAAKTVVVSGGVLVVAGTLAQLVAATGWHVLLGRVTMGMGEAALFSAALPWVLRDTPVQRRGRVSGWFGASMWSGLALGPLVAVLAARTGTVAGWTLTVAFGVACTLVAVSMPRPARRSAGPLRLRVLWPRGIGGPGIVFGLAAYGYGTVSSLLVLFLSDDLGGEWAGLALFAISFLAVRVTGSQLVDRYGGSRIAIATLATEAAGFALIAFSTSPGPVFAGIALAGAGCSLIFPSVVALASRTASRSIAGAAIATATSFWDLGVLAAGVGSGTVAKAAGYPAAFAVALVAALMGVVATVVFSAARRRPAGSTFVEAASGRSQRREADGGST